MPSRGATSWTLVCDVLRIANDVNLAAPSNAATGDQLEWTRLVPAMWRALADPEGVHLWPSRPDPADYGSPSWWLPAVELMAYSLAWPRLDLGLRWWYDAGQPTDDPRLLLLREMLGGDVDELAAWAWSSNYAHELCQRGSPTRR